MTVLPLYDNAAQVANEVRGVRERIGGYGNCFDYINQDTGICVSKYGAHLFHTYYKRVWKYVHQWSDWTPYEHKVIALINGKPVPIPVKIDTVNALFELDIKDSTEMDKWLQSEQVKPKHGGKPMNLGRNGPLTCQIMLE